jgi:hypothetical protein
MGSKERDDLVHEVFSFPYHIDERPVPTTCSCVRSDPATAGSDLQELEDRGSLGVLADMELWYELPTEPCGRIALDRDVEASFPVDVSRKIVVQSFLLIVRRGHEDHPPVGLSLPKASPSLLPGCDIRSTAGCIRSSQHLAEFIDSAIYHVCYLRAAAVRRSAARSFLFRLAPHVAMGVGPSLHGLMPVFGVWPLRILDDQSSLRYLPPPFILTARSRSRWNPSAERCSRFSIAVTMTAKVSNSRRFSLRMGWARKNGMTFVRRSLRFRTT